MSRHTVSWTINDSDSCVSPTLSSSSASAVSIVSINSIVSDTHTTGAQPAGFRAKFTYFLAPDDSFVPHDTYFFKDGNITFLVDGTLYCVHRYFFSRDSAYFSTRFDQLDVRDHEPLGTIISLSGVERKDFEAFLSVVYPINFEEHNLSYEQWRSVLHLSTRWGFDSLRNLALKSIKPPTPFDELLLARAYNVDHWALPALSALCKRTVPISLKEARRMSIDDVVLIATIREELRNLGPFFGTAGIERRIKAVQVRMVDVASDDVSSDFPESGAAEKELSKSVTGTGAKADSYNGTNEVAASKTVDMHGSEEHPVRTAESEREFPRRNKEEAKSDSYKGTKGVAVAITSKAVHNDWGSAYPVDTDEDEWVIPIWPNKEKGHTAESAEDERAIPARSKKKRVTRQNPVRMTGRFRDGPEIRRDTVETTEDE